MYWMEVAPSRSARQASRRKASRARLTRPDSGSLPRAVTTPTPSSWGKSRLALTAKFRVMPPGRSVPRFT